MSMFNDIDSSNKNNNLKMSWRSVPMQSKFDKANGVSADLVLKNMVQRWLTRKDWDHGAMQMPKEFVIADHPT